MNDNKMIQKSIEESEKSLKTIEGDLKATKDKEFNKDNGFNNGNKPDILPVSSWIIGIVLIIFVMSFIFYQISLLAKINKLRSDLNKLEDKVMRMGEKVTEVNRKVDDELRKKIIISGFVSMFTGIAVPIANIVAKIAWNSPPQQQGVSQDAQIQQGLIPSQNMNSLGPAPSEKAFLEAQLAAILSLPGSEVATKVTLL